MIDPTNSEPRDNSGNDAKKNAPLNGNDIERGAVNPNTQKYVNHMKENLISIVESGCSIIPTVNKVPPFAWKPYTVRRADETEVRTWVKNFDSFAIVCGAISGGLECIDVDEYNAPGTWDGLAAVIKELSPDLFSRLVIERTMRGGYHILFRSSAAQGNLKLAMSVEGDTVIETRGQGGYFVCHPSPGYTQIQKSVDDIPTITTEERNELLMLCRSFDAVLPEMDSEKRKATQGTATGVLSPGADFDNRGDVLALLLEHGWTAVFERDECYYLRRPGKSDSWSATYNYKNSRRLRVFSSNAKPFKHNKSYRPFAVYSYLKHNGNFHDAEQALYEMQFGDRSYNIETASGGGGSKSKVLQIRSFFDSGYRFRYNEITGRYSYCCSATKGEWNDLTDYQVNSIITRLWDYKVNCSRSTVETIIYSEYSPAHNPFSEYLATLPEWDGTDHILALANTVRTLPEHQEAFRLYLRKWLVSHTAQITQGKCNHTALVLMGGQGIGKTTWLNRLCPPELQTNYLYVGDIDARNKDSQITIAENWLVNLDELESMQRVDIGHLKSLFTMDKINVRRPYAHHAESLKRRASFVGSVNKGKFLTDETGNRRFLVVEVTGFEQQPYEHMDQVWAQALGLLKSGYRYWFTQDESVFVNEQNEDYRVTTLVEELVSEYITADPSQSNLNFRTTTKLAEELIQATKLNIGATDYFVRQLGSAMRRAGLTKHSCDGRRGYYAIVKLPDHSPF